jgi:hypothetical protein
MYNKNIKHNIMNQEFKRMQKLAGLNEASIVYGDPSNLKYYNEWKELVDKHPELYKGLKEAIQSPQFSKGIKEYQEEFRQWYKDDGDDDVTEEEYVEMFTWDFYNRVVIAIWGKTFIKNLLDNGFTYDSDDDSWTAPDKYVTRLQDRHLTNYGIVWEFFPDLDTSARESVGEYLEEFVKENI